MMMMVMMMVMMMMILRIICLVKMTQELDGGEWRWDFSSWAED